MQYRFTCKCEACENDFPTLANLMPKRNIPYVMDEHHFNRLINYDFDFALKNYRKYCEYLNKYSDAYPCDQISKAEESLKMALHILVDAVPLKAKMNQSFQLHRSEEDKYDSEIDDISKTDLKNNHQLEAELKTN